MKVTVIKVPYDSSLVGKRMGAGPQHLLDLGLMERLSAEGNDTELVVVGHRTEPPAEIKTAFELMQGVAACVRTALSKGSFPLVIAGNCNTSVGVVSGVGDDDLGIVWLDAHADFLTPEETTSGFLDGMALAIMAGRCWRPLAASVSGFRAIAGPDILLVGARSLDAPEGVALENCRVRLVSPSGVRAGALGVALGELATRTDAVHLHIDLDVLDVEYGNANTYAAVGGLSPVEVNDLLGEVGDRLRIRSLTLAAIDPSTDRTGSVGRSAIDFAARVAGLPAVTD